MDRKIERSRQGFVSPGYSYWKLPTLGNKYTVITQIESIINNLKKAFKRRFNFLSDIEVHNSHYTGLKI